MKTIPQAKQQALCKFTVQQASVEYPDGIQQSESPDELQQEITALSQFEMSDYPAKHLIVLSACAVGACSGLVLSALARMYFNATDLVLPVLHAAVFGVLSGAITGMLTGGSLGLALHSLAMRRFEYTLSSETGCKNEDDSFSREFGSVDQIQQWKRAQGQYSQI
ncbi:hypothetical protein [Undibacterium curvum]|uniref:Uncharacterized protein n=1 Tax=Undibacterium curvum TaxID=2762294 RepID=A0ABR7A0S0_9BURK|nr:hypothetical protein [Undibacterium curvum]MBC3930283.1 hypothetical protein [Undibacterium curvum]